MRLLVALVIVGACSAARVPRPSATPHDTTCSRLLSREAASIIEADVLEPASLIYAVSPSSACPLLPASSRYVAAEAAKRELRHTLWQCTACGKQFKNEWYLDRHLCTQHRELDAAAAPCLADYCGMLGCPSLDTTPLQEDDSELAAVEEAAAQAEADAEADTDTDASTTEGEGVPAPPPSDGRLLRGGSGFEALLAATTRGGGDSSEHATRYHPRLHHKRTTASLSPVQSAAAAACRATMDACFPLPSPSPAPAPAHSAAAGAAGATADAGTAAGSSGGSGVTGAQFLRGNISSSSGRSPHERVSALRQYLYAELCDAPPAAKQQRAAARTRAASLKLALYIVAASVVVMGVLGFLLWLTQDAEGPPRPGTGGSSRQRGRKQDSSERRNGNIYNSGSPGVSLSPVTSVRGVLLSAGAGRGRSAAQRRNIGGSGGSGGSGGRREHSSSSSSSSSSSGSGSMSPWRRQLLDEAAVHGLPAPPAVPLGTKVRVRHAGSGGQ